jgi:hypothetical protein
MKFLMLSQEPLVDIILAPAFTLSALEVCVSVITVGQSGEWRYESAKKQKGTSSRRSRVQGKLRLRGVKLVAVLGFSVANTACCCAWSAAAAVVPLHWLLHRQCYAPAFAALLLLLLQVLLGPSPGISYLKSPARYLWPGVTQTPSHPLTARWASK